jgi:hypothetical protein
LKSIFEIIDSLKMKKSSNSRQIVDRLYNLKNNRSSVVSKKSPIQFDIDKVMFEPKAELPSLETGPTGERGENKISGSDV